MSSTEKTKEAVTRRTFEKWWFKKDFNAEFDDSGLVIKLTCIVCVENLAAIYREARLRSIRGTALKSIQHYADGITYVHKANIERHVKSGSLHDWAKKLQKSSELSSELKANVPTPCEKNQPTINTVIEKNVKEHYIHAFNTALYLAKEEKPYSDFPELISLQRQNGVSFLNGKDSEITCREFISYISDAMRLDIKRILTLCNFFTGEQDGSQPQKTGSTKELIFVKIVINGAMVEIMLKCQHMNDYGEDAASVKRAFDDTLLKDFEMSPDKFQNSMICVCADGASINMGSIKGACTEMKKERDWLLVVHCANHRLELSISDAFKADKVFTRIDEILINIYYLFKNSGKAKRIILEICLNLGVTFVNFVRGHGTRFQNHKYRGVKVLIINFLSLCMYAENMIAGGSKVGCSAENSAKLNGYLKEWKSYQYLAALHLYRQVLCQTAHISYVLQKQTVLITDIISAIDECKEKLTRIQSSAEEADLPFEISDSTDDKVVVTAKATNLPATQSFRKKHYLTEKQKKTAKKCITIQTDSVELNKVKEGKKIISKVKNTLIPEIQRCIEARFSNLMNDEIYRAFSIADISTWDFDNSEFGLETLRILAAHFQSPLQFHDFSLSQAITEFKEMKRLIQGRYRHFVSKTGVWEQIFPNYIDKYPHALLIIELCLTMSWSSASVERGFSTLKRVLTDSRLSLNKSSLDDLLMIIINLPILKKLDPQYESKLIDKAVDRYLSTKQRYHHTKSKKRAVTVSGPEKSMDYFLPTPFKSSHSCNLNPLLEDDPMDLDDSDEIMDSEISSETDGHMSTESD